MRKIHCVIAIFMGLLGVNCSTPRHAETAPVTSQKPINTMPADKIETNNNVNETFFNRLFSGNESTLGFVQSKMKAYNIQVIYTQINRDAQNNPSFITYSYNTNPAAYYYPASTVKLPIVLLALQKLQELKLKNIDKYSSMINDVGYTGQTATYNDPNTPDGRPCIAQYIKRILLVSDNDAFNRLYEFLGQEYINKELHKKGYASAQILHRLDVYLTADENRHTNPIRFYDTSGNLLYEQPLQFNRSKYDKRNDIQGDAFYDSKHVLQQRPMDFSGKNRLDLESLNKILMSVVMPQSVQSNQRFNISEEDRKFVLKYMSAYPAESVYPSYDKSYYDTWVKFLYYGSDKTPVEKSVRIFNKAGNAYGQLIDAAYIVDFDKKIEFFLSATINCNTDGILNDDKYDYNSLGFPFMKNLGRAIYKEEQNRRKKYLPNLDAFHFNYADGD